MSTWNLKYVIVTIGKLIWYPISSSMMYSGNIIITEKMRKQRHEMSIRSHTPLFLALDENTEARCSLSRKRNVNHVFDVVNKVTADESNNSIQTVEELESYLHHSCNPNAQPSAEPSSESSVELSRSNSSQTIEKHFMCETDEERDSWLRAIRRARKGRNNDPTVWFSQRVFMAIRTLSSQTKSINELTRLLNAIIDVPLQVPVYFIQSLTTGCRGPAPDVQMTQVMRDLERETVVFGDRMFQGVLGDSDSAGFASKIVFLLMESIRRKDTKLKAWEVLRFARNVLLHTYRSQTGGDCYDALEALLPSSNLIHILQKGKPTSKNPIRISVTDTVPTVTDVVDGLYCNV